MKKENEYNDYTLTIPADILMIVDRAKTAYEDFDFTIHITNGKPNFVDLVGYWDDGGYNERSPEESWALVRKWWSKEKEEVQFDEEVIQAKEQLELAQSKLKELEAKAKKKGWHWWS